MFLNLFECSRHFARERCTPIFPKSRSCFPNSNSFSAKLKSSASRIRTKFSRGGLQECVKKSKESFDCDLMADVTEDPCNQRDKNDNPRKENEFLQLEMFVSVVD